MRCLVLFLVVGLLTSSVRAGDLVEVALTKLDEAKKLYTETADQAKRDLEAAGERELKKLRAANAQNVEQQIAKIEKLEDQLRVFTELGKLPTDSALRKDADRYRETLNKARQKCEKAFDLLAQRYVAAKDDSNAKKTLEEKSRYFQQGFPPGKFVLVTNPPYGFATVELTAEGEFRQIQDEKWTFTGTWSHASKEELLLRYVSANYGSVALKIEDEDHLAGQNIHPDGKTWGWRLIRQSAATFPAGDFECTTDPDEGRWSFSLKNDGTCTNTSPDGKHVDHGNWQQYGDEVRFAFCHEGYYDKVGSSGVLKIEDNDHLSGYNRLTVSRQEWAWKAVRKKTETNKK